MSMFIATAANAANAANAARRKYKKEYKKPPYIARVHSSYLF